MADTEGRLPDFWERSISFPGGDRTALVQRSSAAPVVIIILVLIPIIPPPGELAWCICASMIWRLVLSQVLSRGEWWY